MSKCILGTGACGFLKVHNILNENNISVIYKSDKCKYQNSREQFNQFTLLWDESLLSSVNNFLSTIPLSIIFLNQMSKKRLQLLFLDENKRLYHILYIFRL